MIAISERNLSRDVHAISWGTIYFIIFYVINIYSTEQENKNDIELKIHRRKSPKAPYKVGTLNLGIIWGFFNLKK